ncbi:MAG: class I SAM-dependent methyltransferase [Proteobacteria bacterium]|nr:class I SAM-dependent methyltransferase [Pseudomonadota bacterium]
MRARHRNTLRALLLGIAALGCAAAAAAAAFDTPGAGAAAARTDHAAPTTDAATLKLIDVALAGEHRSAQNKARDVYRHPRQTLQFFGLRGNQSVIEIAPGGGWYTEILAPVLKDHGHYAAGVAPPKSADAEDSASMKALKEKFAQAAQVLGTLHTVPFGPDVTEMAPPGSVDMILTFRNLHNWMGGAWADKALALMFKALKPGGILGVTDHRGNPSVPQDPKARSGYVNQDYAIKLIEAAGFKLVGQSEVNANPKDTKDYAQGVWTLPPTLTLGEKDRDKYLNIGESDRFTLKFRKP